MGFVGPALGLSLGWSIVAGALGILTGTVFMAFHAAQGPTFGLPQMIQSRAQFGYRGVVVALFATATNLVDFFFVRRGHYATTDLFTPRGIYGEWAWRG